MSSLDISLSFKRYAKNNVTLVADGTFTKDGIYYIPVQTRPNTKIGTLTLTFTRSDGEESVISTTALNNLILQSGLVYDLKCPVVSFDPIINAEDVSLDAKATVVGLRSPCMRI